MTRSLEATHATRWRRRLTLAPPVACVAIALTACGGAGGRGHSVEMPAGPSRIVDAPARVMIPAIDVDAPVVPLQLNADGSLRPPEDPATAGWFKDGPEPGEPGASVIAGHIDSKTGPAVFFKLAKLRRGDIVAVADNGAAHASFVVDRVERYPKSAFPTEDVYTRSREPLLRLITCGGEFDHSTGHYLDNVVVYARLHA